MRIKQFKHEFVHRIPKTLNDGILYICIDCNIVMHKCACGCGEEVATPIEKGQWKLTYDGEAVSLYPSIGNWNYNCQSHYFIREDKVVWANKISDYDDLQKQQKKKSWFNKVFKTHRFYSHM